MTGDISHLKLKMKLRRAPKPKTLRAEARVVAARRLHITQAQLVAFLLGEPVPTLTGQYWLRSMVRMEQAIYSMWHKRRSREYLNANAEAWAAYQRHDWPMALQNFLTMCEIEFFWKQERKAGRSLDPTDADEIMFPKDPPT